VANSPQITSRQNPRFKVALALREARERRTQKRLLVDGAREIDRALQAGVPVVEAWVATERIRSEGARGTLVALGAAGVEIIEATPELLARLSYGERDEGIVAVLRQPSTELADLLLPEVPLIAVVERVEKPGNIGALLRSADGAGVDAVIVADPVSDIWNPNAIRASLGTIFSQPVATASSEEAIEFLTTRGIGIFAAWVDAELEYDAADFRGPAAIVVGSENLGLGGAWQAPGITTVAIPMAGLADSLNVSASAAVLLYEARRQRRHRG
jgi:TrmH family RNA methyltransferase